MYKKQYQHHQYCTMTTTYCNNTCTGKMTTASMPKVQLVPPEPQVNTNNSTTTSMDTTSTTNTRYYFICTTDNKMQIIIFDRKWIATT